MTDANTLIAAAAAYDDEAGAGAATLMADASLDAAGDNLVERLVLALMSFYPTDSEADIRAAVHAHWMF